MRTHPLIHKRSGVYVPAPCQETTIIKAPNGQMVTVSFRSTETKIIVRDYDTAQVLAERPWPVQHTGGGTAIVSDSVLHILAAAPFVGTANQIVRARLDANWAMNTPATVYTATAPDNICNLGICASPFGYIMSCETQQTARQVFFLRSTDLQTWTPIGAPMATGAYVGSPKLYYSARRNKFFLTLLRMIPGANNTFYTAVAMLPPTLDSYALYQGEEALLYPDGAGESYNTSDLTMAERDGRTYMVYLDGTQYDADYTNYRTAIFDGSMEKLWELFFPVEVAEPEPPPLGGNLIPAMTGQTTSGVTITASDTFLNSSFHPWYAADRNGATFWHCNTQVPYPHYLRVDFPESVTLGSYAIKARAGYVGQAPRNFSLRGLRVSDGAWITLDSRVNQTYTDGAFKVFGLANAATYASFHLVVDSNVEGSANLSVGDFELRGVTV